MNTKPDDELLALWVEDELNGDDEAAVEAWASRQSDWLERREQARAWKSLASGVLSASEDVPHAEFFNARIRREIEVVSEREKPTRGTPIWAWFVPAAAAAGMVFGFVMGRGGPSSGAGNLELPVAVTAPVLYTPTKGVKAEFLDSDDATVIVLAGMDAIPDTWEVPETAVLEKERPWTASRKPE